MLAQTKNLRILSRLTKNTKVNIIRQSSLYPTYYNPQKYFSKTQNPNKSKILFGLSNIVESNEENINFNFSQKEVENCLWKSVLEIDISKRSKSLILMETILLDGVITVEEYEIIKSNYEKIWYWINSKQQIVDTIKSRKKDSELVKNTTYKFEMMAENDQIPMFYGQIYVILKSKMNDLNKVAIVKSLPMLVNILELLVNIPMYELGLIANVKRNIIRLLIRCSGEQGLVKEIKLEDLLRIGKLFDTIMQKFVFIEKNSYQYNTGFVVFDEKELSKF